MKKIIKEAIEVIKNTINKEEFITKHKTNEKDFTRKRKLGFREIMYFVLGLSNSCLDFEKNYFCDVFKIEILYDRGFASVALIQKLEEKGIYFVARVSKSFIKEINESTKQKTLDKTIHIDYTQERAKKSKVKDVKLPYSFDLRCVRIFLKSKQQEILITNLPREEFKRKDAGHLYPLRWGIEAGFNHLKNALYLEAFVGIKENSIKQEFYSILIKYNIIMLFTEEAKIMEMNNKKNFKVGI